MQPDEVRGQQFGACLVKDTLDFIIIGAQKAGTTSLFEYLRQHPELSLPPGKEVPYFSHEAARARGWTAYMRKGFRFADASSKWGTVTPQYMVGGLWDQPNPLPSNEVYDERTVPMRIRECLPEIRLIAILRDPVDRARSHYRMAVMNEIEKRTFDQAIDHLLRPDVLEHARREPNETTGYVAWGEYGRILAGYFDIFSREQILVLFTEDLRNDPEQLVRRVYKFVGVRADFTPDNLGMRYRVGGDARRFSWLAANSQLNPWRLQERVTGNSVARGLWHALPERRRHQFDRMFTRIAHRTDLLNRRTNTEVIDADHATLERLRAHYGPDTQRLAALIGADPPWQR
jgi:hypothetical protein